MAKRPRGTCRVCGRAWRARWQGDSLIVLNHSDTARECAGSGQPDAAEPLPATTLEPSQLQPRHSGERVTAENLRSWAQAS